MKKILLMFTLSVAVFQVAFSQNVPFVGVVFSGQVQNVMSGANMRNDMAFALKNNGPVPLRFYMASSTVSRPSGPGIVVAANSQVTASVGDMGGITAGKNLNVSNEDLSPEKLGIYNVLPNVPTVTSGANCLNIPQWTSDVPNKTLYACYGTVGIGTTAPSTNYVLQVIGLSRFDGTNMIQGNQVVSEYQNVGFNIKTDATYPEMDRYFGTSLNVHGFGTFGSSNGSLDIGVGGKYFNAHIESTIPLNINYYGSKPINISGDVHLAQGFVDTQHPATPAPPIPNLIVDGNTTVGQNLMINGKVGIGQSATAKLGISSSAMVTGLEVNHPSGSDYSYGEIIRVDNDLVKAFVIENNNSKYTNKDITRFKVDGNGDTYINGTLRAKEVLIRAVIWPDYVFKKDYKLKSIAELEQYISANGHLPNIPSAEEVEKSENVDLGAMNVKLLEKVEELTLYMIEMKKSNEAVQKANEQMQKENSEIKEQLNRLQAAIKKNK